MTAGGCYLSGRSASVPITSIWRMSSVNVSSGRSGPNNWSLSLEPSAFETLRRKAVGQQFPRPRVKALGSGHKTGSQRTVSRAESSRALQWFADSAPRPRCQRRRPRWAPEQRHAFAHATSSKTLRASAHGSVSGVAADSDTATGSQPLPRRSCTRDAPS